MNKKVWLVAYVAAIFAANWLIRNVGTPIGGGTHVLPVWPGVYAASGVYAAGFVLVARDLAQRTNGRAWGLVMIVPGALLSALLNVDLAIASGAAFLLSELADFAIFTPLSRRGLAWTVLVSAVLSAVVDSVVFLALAHIPMTLLPGQIIGKGWVALLAFVLIKLTRRAIPAAQPV